MARPAIKVGAWVAVAARMVTHAPVLVAGKHTRK
jgi:hypothetical protein